MSNSSSSSSSSSSSKSSSSSDSNNYYKRKARYALGDATNKIFITNISPRVTEEKLEKIFS